VRVALFGIFTFFSFPGLLLFSESDSLFFSFSSIFVSLIRFIHNLI
jgi:hypothetical protein